MIDNEISGALSDITVDFMLTRGLPGWALFLLKTLHLRPY
jgi:hypothetical protein